MLTLFLQLHSLRYSIWRYNVYERFSGSEASVFSEEVASKLSTDITVLIGGNVTKELTQVHCKGI